MTSLHKRFTPIPRHGRGAGSPRGLTTALGTITLACGLVVMVGWQTHTRTLVEWVSSSTAMQYNSAVGFALCGAGIVALAWGHGRSAALLGSGAGLLGLGSLVAYLLGLDLGIDQLLITPYFAAGAPGPDRMAPNTALCFVLAGAALLLLSGVVRVKQRPLVLGLLGAVIVALGTVAGFGYLVSMSTAYRWGTLTAMAAQTALLFMLLGSGLIAAAWRASRTDAAGAPGWLAALVGAGTASATLLLWQALIAEAPPAGMGAVLPYVTLAGGLLMAAVLVCAVQSGQIARRQARLAAQANQALKTEIVERRRVEQERDRQLDLIQAITSNLGEGVYAVDRAGCVTWINPMAQRLLGWTEAELLGQNMHELIHCQRADGTRELANVCPLLAVIQSGAVMQHDADIVTRQDGSLLPVAYTASPIVTDGRISGAVLVFRDIGERKRVEAEVYRAKEAAEQANRAKSEFLSRMSHELRTPLNSILGFAQLLEMQELTADQRESVHFIRTGGRHLLQLINEVLDIARIEAGRLSLSPEPMAVAELLAECLSLVQPLAAARQVQLATDLPDGCRQHVLADRQRLQQVLLNLLSNAVKYNRPDGTVDLLAAPAPGQRLRIGVRDTGLGIPPEHLRRLFTPFDRLGVEQGSVEGTGLGLALSRGLLEAMEGTLTVESTVGSGSIFWLELPIVESPLARLGRAEEAIGVTSYDSGQVYRVLYIEDNLANLALIERLLAHRPGVKLLAAMQGQLGVELAQQQPPNLILLDLHLPDMSGDEVLQRLRAAPATRQIPVVVMSADATPRRIAQLRAAGVRDYLSKPIDVPRFLAVTDAILQEGAS
jgi:PAS domain S-box-containing protein